MKKTILFATFLLGMLMGTAVLADDDVKDKHRLMFTVSSDDLDAPDSLNRISGAYDNGVLPEENRDHSKKNFRANPLRERSYEEVS